MHTVKIKQKYKTWLQMRIQVLIFVEVAFILFAPKIVFAAEDYAAPSTAQPGCSAATISSPFGAFGNATAVGCGATSINEHATSLGANAQANQASTAIGSQSSTGFEATAVGFSSASTGMYSTAYGAVSSATAMQSLAVGMSSTASALGASVVGSSASATAAGATALGYSSNATAVNSLALGRISNANAELSIAAGYRANASSSQAIAIGADTIASGASGIAMGYNAAAQGSQSIAIGAGTNSSGDGAIRLGNGGSASGVKSLGLGYNANASGDEAIAIGHNSSAAYTNSTALGYGAASTNTNQIMLGTSTTTYTAPGLTSAASKAAQSGATQYVTTDAQGNLASAGFGPSDITGLHNSVSNLQNGQAILGQTVYSQGQRINSNQNEARQGIAMAAAMSQAPMPSAPGKTSWKLNNGIYKNAAATSLSIAHRLPTRVPVAVTAGVAIGLRNSAIVTGGLQGEF